LGGVLVEEQFSLRGSGLGAGRDQAEQGAAEQSKNAVSHEQ
jgi:hypothetical protein